MSKNIEKLLNTVKHIRLDGDTKNLLRADLDMFAHAHPVRGISRERLSMHESSHAFFGRFISINTLQNMALGVLIALIIGGSTSYAAEGAVPGDLLYPVKITVNENVRGAFTVSPRAQASWDTRIAERRVEEAVVLASRGEITLEHDEVLKEMFEKHTEKAEAHIAQIEEKGSTEEAIEARSEFEARLRAQQNVLMSVVAGTDEIRANTDGLIDSLRTRIENTTNVRTQIGIATHIDGDTSITAGLEKSSVERKAENVNKRIKDAEVYVENKKEDVNEKIYIEANIKVKAAQELFEDAEIKIEEGDFVGAFNILTESQILAEEARIYVRTSARLIKDGGRNSTEETPTPRQEDNHASKTIKIDALVSSGLTVVTGMVDDTEISFETNARTESGLVTEIMERYDLSQEEVESALNLQVEGETREEQEGQRGNIIEVDGGIEISL